MALFLLNSSFALTGYFVQSPSFLITSSIPIWCWAWTRFLHNSLVCSLQVFHVLLFILGHLLLSVLLQLLFYLKISPQWQWLMQTQESLDARIMRISSWLYFSIIHYTKCWSNTSRNVGFFIFPCIIPSFSWSLISSEPGFKYIGLCSFWLLEIFWLPSDQGPHSFHLFSLQILLLKYKIMSSSQHVAFYFSCGPGLS